MDNINFDFVSKWSELFGPLGAISGAALAIIIFLLWKDIIQPFSEKSGTIIFCLLCLVVIAPLLIVGFSGSDIDPCFDCEESTAINWGHQRGGLIVSKEGIVKNGGSAWDADVVSNNFIPAGAAGKVSHKINCTTAIYAFGLASSNQSMSYDDADYGMVLSQKGGTQLVAQLPSNLGVDFKTLEVGHVISIEKSKDGTVTYEVTGKVPYTSVVKAKGDLRLDVSVYNAGCPISGFSLEGDWKEKK